MRWLCTPSGRPATPALLLNQLLPHRPTRTTSYVLAHRDGPKVLPAAAHPCLIIPLFKPHSSHPLRCSYVLAHSNGPEILPIMEAAVSLQLQYVLRGVTRNEWQYEQRSSLTAR